MIPFLRYVSIFSVKMVSFLQTISLIFLDISYLCSANTFIRVLYAKLYLQNTEAAYGCKSRDFSISIECVSSDCLFFLS